MAQYERNRQDLDEEEIFLRVKASATPRVSPIPQPAPERRDFYYRDPRQKEADFWQDLKLGLLLTLALLGSMACVYWGVWLPR